MATSRAFQSDVHPLLKARNVVGVTARGSHIDLVQFRDPSDSDFIFGIANIDLTRLGLELVLRVFKRAF